MAEKINTDTEISTSELAFVLGLTGRRIRQLTEDGVLTKIKNGRYNLTQSVQQYIDFRSSKEKGASDTDKAKQEADISIKKAKAIISVLEAQELQGKMHRSEDVADMTDDLIHTIQTTLESLTEQLTKSVAGKNSSPEIYAAVRKEVYKVMSELSGYKYKPKSK